MPNFQGLFTMKDSCLNSSLNSDYYDTMEEDFILGGPATTMNALPIQRFNPSFSFPNLRGIEGRVEK
jgi:hypothetical protein